MKRHTLRTIADETDRDKRTVQGWYQRAKSEHGELGELIEGVRCFDDSERSVLVSYAGEKPIVKEPTAPRVSVEVGNHTTRKMIHVGATAASLEQFRTQRDRLQLGNRGEFVTHALGFLDQLEEGIEAAEAEQEQELQQIRTAKKQVSKRVAQFRRRADEYRIKSDLLAHIQNTELEDLEDLASELTAMGKPPTAEAAAPGVS